MRAWTAERWTGTAGVVATVLLVIAFVLYFAVGAPTANTADSIVTFLRQSSGTIETSALLIFVALSIFFVFLAGLRAMIVRADPNLDYLGTAVFGIGAAGAILAFVGLGLSAAAAANAAGTPDAPAVHAMVVASSVIGGAPDAIPMVFFLGVAGWALSKSAILPRWTVWLSWVAAVLVLVTVPALYGGDNPLAFYTADGFVTVIASLPLYVWMLLVSIAILRKSP